MVVNMVVWELEGYMEMERVVIQGDGCIAMLEIYAELLRRTSWSYLMEQCELRS